MEDKFILAKDHLRSLLRRLMKNSRLIAPVKNRHGDTFFCEIDSLDQAEIDLVNQPQSSAKSFFLPQQETLFTYTTDHADGYELTPVVSGGPAVYFGLRSCDLAAILYMDVIFIGNKYRDPYYRQKREGSVLISIGCNEPFANCFCNATRSGPFLEFGFDLRFTDLGNRFFVEPGRARGNEIIKQWASFFTPAGEEDGKAQYQLSLEARGSFRRRVDVELACRRLASGMVDQAVFAELSGRCQGCGGCAYLCPTCTCFTIIDRPTDERTGERLRIWDACTFAGFTRMAGGHNPVDAKTQALRKRFCHKLQQDVARHGRPSCVGCGRCVGMCFDGVDMVRFVDKACQEK